MADRTLTFQKALDVVESLPEHQQENLVEIIRHRLVEHRRDVLARSIGKARQEHARGDVKEGAVDDLMKDLLE
jgi:hypothetical protein